MFGRKEASFCHTIPTGEKLRNQGFMARGYIQVVLLFIHFWLPQIPLCSSLHCTDVCLSAGKGRGSQYSMCPPVHKLHFIHYGCFMFWMCLMGWRVYERPLPYTTFLFPVLVASHIFPFIIYQKPDAQQAKVEVIDKGLLAATILSEHFSQGMMLLPHFSK